MELLKKFSLNFIYLEQSYRTCEHFPINESCVVLHYGQYLDSNFLELFFAEELDPKMFARFVFFYLYLLIYLKNYGTNCFKTSPSCEKNARNSNSTM